MPRPRFRLEPLLQAQRREETLLRVSFEARREVLETARRRHDDALGRLIVLRSAPPAGSGPAHLGDLQAHIGMRTRAVAEARIDLASAQDAVDEARAPLLRVVRLRVALELLRDRRQAAHTRAQRIAEEVERDEQSRGARLANEVSCASSSSMMRP